jgi:magnesium transporter
MQERPRGQASSACAAFRPSASVQEFREMRKGSSRGHRQRRAMRRGQPGAPPGMLFIDPESPSPRIHLFAYGPEQFLEQEISEPEMLRAFLGKYPVVWVNVDGLGSETVLLRLAELFHLHPLALEDVVHVHQRAKVDQFGEQYFIVTHMVALREQLAVEQISLFLGQTVVLTFQERPGWDCLEPVRDRLRKDDSRMRMLGADYLAYALLDAVTDQYFPVLEQFGERLEDLEDRIIARPARAVVREIHDVKRQLLSVRRTIWPQREALNSLVRDEIPQISPETRLYLRDCYDHAVRIIDLVETYREVSSDLMDLYLSSLSFRMNEIMKVLTLMSTLFIPLTFIVGLYGMNFNPRSSPWNMPELNWYFGYPVCLGVMAGVVCCQFLYFWRKGWIGGEK